MAFLRYSYVSQCHCHWAQPPLSRYVNVLAMTICGNEHITCRLIVCESVLLPHLAIVFWQMSFFPVTAIYFNLFVRFSSLNFFYSSFHFPFSSCYHCFRIWILFSIVICSFGRNTSSYSHYHTIPSPFPSNYRRRHCPPPIRIPQ